MNRLIFCLVLFFAGPAAWAVEIPVHGGGGVGDSVGYVDMELVFREYPEAKKAREDYQKEVFRHKTYLADREMELEDLKREIEALKATRSPLPVVELSSSTASSDPIAVSSSPVNAAAVAASIANREEQLLKQKEELEQARATAARDLRAFEASRSKIVLGRLYKALVDLADERGIKLVVDKSAILYGENTIDLTEALNRRVRGLPEEEKKAEER